MKNILFGAFLLLIAGCSKKQTDIAVVSPSPVAAASSANSIKYSQVTLTQPVVISKSGDGFVMPEFSTADSLKFNFEKYKRANFINSNNFDSVARVIVVTKKIQLAFSLTSYFTNASGLVNVSDNPQKFTKDQISNNFAGSGAPNYLIEVTKDANCSSCVYTGNYDPATSIPPFYNSKGANFSDNDEGYLLFRYTHSDGTFSYGWIIININHNRVIIKGYAFQGMIPLKAGQ